MSDFQNIRDALKTISWEDEPYGLYFAITYQNRELNGSMAGDKAEIADMDTQQLERVVSDLAELDERALELIQRENPDEDAGELELSDIIIYVNGAVSLGYDASESPAGQLYIYAAFNADFSLQDELIFETY